MKINVLTIMLFIVVFGCGVGKKNNNSEISKDSTNQNSTENKITVADSALSPQELFNKVVLDAPNYVYQFLSSKINSSPDLKICSNLKNKTIEVSITVVDTVIIESSSKVYEFNDNGDLVSYSDGGEKLASLFNNLDARQFGFIDTYTISYYDFRIEVNKLCEEFRD
ncbi:MAG: hypothetical protein ACQESM_08950 [Bacteroidota bacterium]